MLYETTITIRVLSNHVIPNDISLQELGEEIDAGDCVGACMVGQRRKVNRKEMDRLLQEFGSDPGFFR